MLTRGASLFNYLGTIVKAYKLISGAGIDGLNLIDLPSSRLAANAMRVRVKAVSLNFRDLMVAKGTYPVRSSLPIIPCSDAAGEVTEVGSDVTCFKVGDRVMNAFFPRWNDGPISPVQTVTTFGADSDGVLAEEIIIDEASAIRIPNDLSYVEASTIPCAGVTAWNALFENTVLKPGDDVLLLGTGGVSIWALQLAKAAGLRPIITSSSNLKLHKAKALGAAVVINYRDTPHWEHAVMEATGGKGVQLVLEVGGQGTLKASNAAAAMGGSIVVIGGVSGFGGQLDPASLVFGNKRVSGILIGSRSMHERVTRFVEASNIKPVIDRVFKFEHAREAFSYLDQAAHFGKVVIASEV